MSQRSAPHTPLPLLGWKEEVLLPELNSDLLVAKVDTGARSSVLHAERISTIGRRVEFEIGAKHFEMRLAGAKRIKSSNGQSEIRPMIETEVVLGTHRFMAAITLTDRGDMEVPMLLGREAIKGRFLVNAARTFIQSRKTRIK